MLRNSRPQLDVGLPPDLASYLDKISSLSSLPVCAGFGIRTADDVVNVGNVNHSIDPNANLVMDSGGKKQRNGGKPEDYGDIALAVATETTADPFSR